MFMLLEGHSKTMSSIVPLVCDAVIVASDPDLLLMVPVGFGDL